MDDRCPITRGQDDGHADQRASRRRPSPLRSTSRATGACARSARRSRAGRAPRTAKQDRELRPDERRRGTQAASASASDQRGRIRGGARDQPGARASQTGIGERLVDEERRVRERRRGRRSDGGEERLRPRDDQARQHVRGEDRRGHQQHAEELDRARKRLLTSSSHQAGAARYAYSETSPPAGRRAAKVAWPVSAIEREIWVNSISSLKSVGRLAPPTPATRTARRARRNATRSRPQRMQARRARPASAGSVTRPRSSTSGEVA